MVLVPSDRVGGAERVLKLVAEEALKAGFQVEVLCWTAGPGSLFSSWNHVRLSVTVVSRVRERIGILLGLLYFAKRMRVRYTFCFSSHVHCNAYLAMLRRLRLLRTDCLVCRESTNIGRRFRGIRRLFYKLCYIAYGREVDMIVCQTDDMRDALQDFAPALPRNRMKVLPNPSRNEAVKRAAAKHISAEPLIVSVGRLIPEKGYSTLIKAFAVLSDKYPRAILRIYGDGPLRDNLTALIASLDLEKRAFLCGQTAEPLGVMSRADICVVSSIQEGFPNTLLEMMKANVRVVSTKCAGGIGEIPGLECCPPGDARALADAIEGAMLKPIIGRAECFDAELARRSPSTFFNSLIGACETDSRSWRLA